MRHSGVSKKQAGVVCVSIGDGVTARTACLAAYLTSWVTVSVDPALRREWAGYEPCGVKRLRGVAAPFEEFMTQTDTLAAIISAASLSTLQCVRAACAENDQLVEAPGGRSACASATVDMAEVKTTARCAHAAASRGGVRHLILLCVHSHHRFTEAANIEKVQQAFGNPPLTVVALPCCSTFNPTKDIGREPDVVFDDLAVFSACRHVLVWNAPAL